MDQFSLTDMVICFMFLVWRKESLVIFLFESMPQNSPEHSPRNLAIVSFLGSTVRIFIGGLLSGLVLSSSSDPDLTWVGKRPPCQFPVVGGCYKSVVWSVK